MPEVYTKEVSDSLVEEYKNLISKLPKDAQQWITGMGQFLDDKKISKSEKKLLELLVSRKDPLIYLTSPRIIDGIWWGQVSAAAAFVMLPPIIATLFLRSYLVRGLTFGAAK